MSVFCLACGQAVTANDRRILRNEASSYVRMMWQRLLDDKLEQKSFRVDVASALGDEESPGCVHRKCFMSIKTFAERRDQFLDKLDAAIEKMPKVPLSEDYDSNHESEATPSRLLQSRKRTRLSTDEERSTSKRLRLIQPSLSQFDTSQSPGVQVPIVSVNDINSCTMDYYYRQYMARFGKQ